MTGTVSRLQRLNTVVFWSPEQKNTYFSHHRQIAVNDHRLAWMWWVTRSCFQFATKRQNNNSAHSTCIARWTTTWAGLINQAYLKSSTLTTGDWLSPGVVCVWGRCCITIKVVEITVCVWRLQHFKNQSDLTGKPSKVWTRLKALCVTYSSTQWWENIMQWDNAMSLQWLFLHLTQLVQTETKHTMSAD